jgi:outer membrane protein OmpA-like peptidoglycan-associated protein
LHRDHSGLIREEQRNSAAGQARSACDGVGPRCRGCFQAAAEVFTREVQDAFFDYDKANIRGDARSALTNTAEFLRSYPQVAIVI